MPAAVLTATVYLSHTLGSECHRAFAFTTSKLLTGSLTSAQLPFHSKAAEVKADVA
jgi:hypothetical protein